MPHILTSMMIPLGIENIHVDGEIGERIDRTISNNLLAVDVEHDFLAPFIERNQESGYVGTGHFLDAVSRLARYDANTDLLDLRERLVGRLAKSQESDGYIGILPPEYRIAALWDVHEMSHLIYGLTTDYRLWENRQSLAAARGIAGLLMARWQGEPERIPRQFVMSTLDSEPAMLSLFEATSDQKYLDFCIGDLKLCEWNRPIIQGRWNRIEGHIYDYLSRCVAQLTLLRWRPEFRLTRATQRALDFMLREDGMVITGELGDHECWHDSQEGTIHLGETCATAYLIRLLHILLQQTHDSLYGDVMERAIYNALFAAQSPDGRNIRYYTPFEGPRSYFGKDTYCCPNNFRRIISELPDMVCYGTSDGVAINLYTSSAAKTTLPDGTALSIIQETNYPSENHVDVLIQPEIPSAFTLSLRIPRWSLTAKIAINGQTIDQPAEPGTFCTVERVWKRGDTVSVEFDMPPRLVRGRSAQAGRAAIMRGPTVYCLNAEKNLSINGENPRLLVVDPGSLKWDGQTCRVRAWSPDSWYPVEEANRELILSRFTDPGGVATYFKTPVPTDRRLVADELLDERSGDVASESRGDFYGKLLEEDLTDSHAAGLLRRFQS